MNFELTKRERVSPVKFKEAQGLVVLIVLI